MTEQHPITPPPELFKQWLGMPRSLAFSAAYRAGADQELEACCEWLVNHNWRSVEPALRAARRPQPPSLAEEALEQLNGIRSVFKAAYGGDLFDDILVPGSPICRALERLQELEQN